MGSFLHGRPSTWWSFSSILTSEPSWIYNIIITRELSIDKFIKMLLNCLLKRYSYVNNAIFLGLMFMLHSLSLVIVPQEMSNGNVHREPNPEECHQT